MRGDHISNSSKDTGDSLDPQQVVRTRVFDLLRQAAAQNPEWSVGERSQGAGTPHEAADKDKGSILSLLNDHIAKKMIELCESRETTHQEALKDIAAMHHKLETSLDKLKTSLGEEYLDDFKEGKKRYVESTERLKTDRKKLNEELKSISESIDQSIQKFNSTSKNDVKEQIQEIREQREKQKNKIETYYDASMNIIEQRKSALQAWVNLVEPG